MAELENKFYESVPCIYCGADRYEPCRHTMLPGQTTDTHQVRILYAQETPF